jgi:nicotinamidase-related amidase
VGAGGRDLDVGELKHNVVGLAKAAQVLRLPIVAATTARDSMWGPPIPELQAALGDLDIYDRSTVSAWDDEGFVARVRQTGRDHLIVAGLSDPQANEIFAALDMAFATLMGQVAAGAQ